MPSSVQMKGAQDRKQKKKQDLQVLAPFPGCLGRVINMFDLSNGVVATKMLTEKAHRDGMPLLCSFILCCFSASCYAAVFSFSAISDAIYRVLCSFSGW